ncbi:MAG: aryl-sulfate sulfotransferase [Flavobacteriales bacterium]|nr:aryl-sulfate sulfotransferase [Flavobacteriales bacterium]
MKFLKFITLLLSSLILLQESTAQIASIYPIPNSEFLSASTNIIIRFQPNSFPKERDFKVTLNGSVSGIIAFETIFISESNTVLLEPLFDFRYGEVATVKGACENPSITLEFSFNISPFDKKIKNHSELNDKPYSLNTKAALFGMDNLVMNIYDTTKLGEGYIFIGPHMSMGDAHHLILDNNGEAVFQSQIPYLSFDFKKQSNGKITFSNPLGNNFHVMDSSYAVVDSFACGNGYDTDRHDLQILPNGNALMICLDWWVVDMSTVVDGGNSSAWVSGAIIQEIDGDNKNVVFEWRSIDHYAITDNLHGANLAASTMSYVHCNSVDVDEDGNIIISSKKLDEVTKIDRSTGDIMWRLGGKNNQFTFIGDTAGFCSQHDARWMGNGNITIFDNAEFTGNSPRAVEYHLDTSFMTATVVREYSDSLHTFSSYMGSLQRLKNGNDLISWGATDIGSPHVTEVDSNGNVVMEIRLDTLGEFRTYRAFRFPWIDSAMVNYLNNKTTFKDLAFINYPNPFSTNTTLFYEVKEQGDVLIIISDITGKTRTTLVNEEQTPGNKMIDLNSENMEAGIYICTLYQGAKKSSIKLVKQ